MNILDCISLKIKMKTILYLIVFLISISAHAQNIDQALIDYKMCGKVIRNNEGEINRRQDVIVAYRKLYPCPSTGKHYGACPNWSLDHTVPLACGGCDSVTNLT